MLRIVCFAEAPADARLGSDLADRVLVEEGPDWVRADLLPDLRTWTGLTPGDTYTKWTALKDLHRQLGGPRYLGRETSGPRGSNYAEAVKALTQAAALRRDGIDVLAVVMLRDCDAAGDRREGLRQAAGEPRFAGLHAVVGIADKMREAWVLNGFVAETQAEQARLARLQAALAFDPIHEAHRLRDHNEAGARSPKRVLSLLTDGDAEREARCWLETPLCDLRTRGAKTGLGQFLDEASLHLPRLL
jgi:hypothetical protein